MKKLILITIIFIMAVGATMSSELNKYLGVPKDYKGYNRYDFKFDGCDCVVLEPKKALEGNPWIWRAEFFEAFNHTLFAFLDRGFYVAYITVGNTFGCPDALKHWDPFYELLTEKCKFSKKPVLEGMSRGGLYIYNWAVRNTDKVSVIYGDAAVCDFKSWPGGFGKGIGSEYDWNKLINDYHFKDEEEAKAYKFNPIDNLEPIAKAKIPIIHVYGDSDQVVPWDENTKILAERYKALGGEIVLIGKEGCDHHPHGLEDPTPVVDFCVDKIYKK